MDRTVSSFLQYLTTEKGFSGHTSNAYRNDLGQFCAFLHQQTDGCEDGVRLESERGSFTWSAVNIDTLNKYVDDLKVHRGYRDATTARKVASIKSFFSFLSEKSIITEDPALSLGSPRVARTTPKFLIEEDVTRLLEAAYKSGTDEGQRDGVIMDLLYATGFRVGELVALNVEGVYLPEAYIRCVGKGNKERNVYLHSKALEELTRYLSKSRVALLANNRTEQALFVNQRGERLSRQWVWVILKTYAEKARIDPDITPYTLRHSYAVHLLQRGASLQQVQKLLGHSSISTTQVYSNMTNRNE